MEKYLSGKYEALRCILGTIKKFSVSFSCCVVMWAVELWFLFVSLLACFLCFLACVGKLRDAKYMWVLWAVAGVLVQRWRAPHTRTREQLALVFQGCHRKCLWTKWLK